MRRYWTREEESLLVSFYGRMPIDDVCQKLARGRNSVQIHAKRIGLTCSASWEWLYPVVRLAGVFGVVDKAVYRYWRREERPLPCNLYYMGNQGFPATTYRQLLAWLRDPMNWYGLDLDKLTDRRLQDVVAHVGAHWGDRWLTSGEAADLIFYSPAGFQKLRRQGRIRGYRHGNYWFLWSDVVALRKRLCQ